MKRVDEVLDEEGYRFVSQYDGADILEKESYRPDGSLMERIVYEWDKAISATLPVRWTAYDEFGKVKNTCVAIEFDARGVHKTVAWYDANGTEKFRKTVAK